MALNRRTKRPVLYFFEAMAYYLVVGILRLIPARYRAGFCGSVTKWLGTRLKRLNGRILRNLAHAMPDLSEDEHTQIAADVWDNLGRTYGEFTLGEGLIEPKTGSDQLGVVTIQNLAEFERIQSEGRGAILVGGHFSNWELSSLVFGRLSDNFHAFYRRPDNHVLDNAVTKMRSATGISLIDRNDRNGLKKALKILKDQGQIGILVDQRIHTADEVDFMDLPAKTISLPYALARSTGAAILPFRILRRVDGGYDGIFDPEIKLPDAEVNKETAQRQVLTQINEQIAAWVRKDPGQWLWLHNRWG